MQERYEMSNKIAIESSKLILNQFKTRHDWAGKVIHSESGKILYFDHIAIWYL